MWHSSLNNINARRLFNPANKSDLIELKYFTQHTKWQSGCPFYLEHPWENIPVMCKDKYAMYMLSKMKAP